MHEELRIENQLCFRLYTASRLITQAYTPLLKELEITYPQYLVMMVLWEEDNQKVNDIAHKLYLESNTVTPLLQRMEKAGLLTRKTAEGDKRQHIVSLTESGKAMEEKALSVPKGMIKSLSSCPIDIEGYEEMKGSLDSIIETLNKKEQETKTTRI